jgi:hypothetical protein
MDLEGSIPIHTCQISVDSPVIANWNPCLPRPRQSLLAAFATPCLRRAGVLTERNTGSRSGIQGQKPRWPTRQGELKTIMAVIEPHNVPILLGVDESLDDAGLHTHIHANLCDADGPAACDLGRMTDNHGGGCQEPQQCLLWDMDGWKEPRLPRASSPVSLYRPRAR